MQQPVARRLVVLAAVLVAGCGGAPHRHAARATAAGPTNRCAPARAHFAVRPTVTPLPRRSAITGAPRRLDPEAWFPAGRRCRAPLIVMSHGHNGAPVACARLCEHLASLGFVVLAP